MTVEVVNVPPVVSGNAGGSIEENSNISFRYSADDPESGHVTWSLSGPDRDDFTIDQSGRLSFASYPDYGIPGDHDRQNDYEVTVRATDDGRGDSGIDSDSA